MELLESRCYRNSQHVIHYHSYVSWDRNCRNHKWIFDDDSGTRLCAINPFHWIWFGVKHKQWPLYCILDISIFELDAHRRIWNIDEVELWYCTIWNLRSKNESKISHTGCSWKETANAISVIWSPYVSVIRLRIFSNELWVRAMVEGEFFQSITVRRISDNTSSTTTRVHKLYFF